MNIEWKDSYCIDNERIDVQHRQLFAHANAGKCPDFCVRGAGCRTYPCSCSLVVNVLAL